MYSEFSLESSRLIIWEHIFEWDGILFCQVEERVQSRHEGDCPNVQLSKITLYVFRPLNKTV